jgi:hypothetical protein
MYFIGRTGNITILNASGPMLKWLSGYDIRSRDHL